MKKERTQRRGAISLEAALALPAVFLLLFFAFSLLGGAAAESRYRGAVDRTVAELSLLSPLSEYLPDLKVSDADLSDAQTQVASGDFWQEMGLQNLLVDGLSDLTATAVLAPLILARIDHWYEQDEVLPASVRDQIENPQLYLNVRQERQQLWLSFSFDLQTPLGAIPRQVEAVVPLWTGSGQIAGEEGDADSIWLLDNFSRGQLLRSHYGANLPYDFPAIARFAGGEAVAITSVDLTAPNYASAAEIRRRVNRHLERLASFQGADYRRGDKVIKIESLEIKTKTLQLIVPENRPAASEPVLQELVQAAAAQGIELSIIAHGQSHRYHDTKPP